jgi:DNA-binding beta-propeller fold protein YncE
MKKITLLIFASLALTICFSQTLELKWKTDTLLKVPESVLFDAKGNLLYIANINGKSGEKDGNGFISKLSSDGKIIKLDWATGLDAPKGMGIYKTNLYVADITRVAVIDLESAKIIRMIDIEGAQFLNDITIDKDGNVYVSDSATGKIHRINEDKLEVYFESKDFKRINGLLAIDDGLYIADAGNGTNYILSKNKTLTKYTETAQGADGIVLCGKNEYIVSSWGGEVYFVDANGKAQKMLDTKEQKLNSADIGYDKKEKIVFVPTFFGNSVMAYEFKK